MSGKNVALSVISSANRSSRWGQIGLGEHVYTQQPDHWAYWFMIIDRRSLKVVYNELHSTANEVPDLGQYNSDGYILALGTLGIGLNNQPQGDLFKFLDANGAGRHLRRVDQIATQFGCGSLGTFGYAMVGVLGDANQPGFEACQLIGGSVGPILTVQLVPMTIGNDICYTPVQLSNA